MLSILVWPFWPTVCTGISLDGIINQSYADGARMRGVISILSRTPYFALSALSQTLSLSLSPMRVKLICPCVGQYRCVHPGGQGGKLHTHYIGGNNTVTHTLIQPRVVLRILSGEEKRLQKAAPHTHAKWERGRFIHNQSFARKSASGDTQAATPRQKEEVERGKVMPGRVVSPRFETRRAKQQATWRKVFQ